MWAFGSNARHSGVSRSLSPRVCDFSFGLRVKSFKRRGTPRNAAEDAEKTNQSGSYFFPSTAARHLPYSSSNCAAYSSGLAADPVP